MPRVRAGDLRQVVTVQKRTETQDAFGDTKLSWSFENTRRAKIRQLTARELEIHSRPEAIATHRIQLRYYPGLSVKQRILFKDRIFNIISVNDEMERLHSTVCVVSEEVD